MDGKKIAFTAMAMAVAVTVTVTMAFPAWAGQMQEFVKRDEMTAAAADEEFPLSEYRDWFVVDPFDGYTTWKWDYDYVGNAKLLSDEDYTPPKQEYGASSNYEYVERHAIADKDFRYLMCPGTSVEKVVIAKLAGVPLTGYDESFISGEEVASLERVTREFLISFDWRNASDEEKAVRIAKRIYQADYDHSDDPAANKSNLTYGCLVNETALCGGYVNAASYLGFCVNLPISGHGVGNHMYPLYRVNGTWLSAEATSKSQVFQIYDPAEGYYLAGNMKYFQQVGEYCDRTGYQAPETLDGVVHDMTLSDGTRIFKSMAWYGGRNADVMQFR